MSHQVGFLGMVRSIINLCTQGNGLTTRILHFKNLRSTKNMFISHWGFEADEGVGVGGWG